MSSVWEKCYPLVPPWAQSFGLSLYGLAWRRERLGGDFPQYVREFRERDAWSPEEFQGYLNAELRKVLSKAFSCVPYYGNAWQNTGVRSRELLQLTVSDLEQLPITRKDDLRKDPDRFVCQPTENARRLHRYYSSGTTGTPIVAICTADGHRKFIAAREARSFNWAGTSLLRPRSMIGGRMVVAKGISKPPYHRYNWAEKQVYFSAYHISPANARHYVEALNRYQPKVCTGYAYSHYLLARMMLDQGLTLDYRPEALVLSSEKLTPEMKKVIRHAFGTRPYEEYGCVENCVLATECEHGRLHVSPDFGILEIVDEHGHAVPPGVEGRILCTSLLNEAQLLVRYENGDLGAWSEEVCPCGRRHLPVLKEVVGRLEDVVTGPDGRQMVRFHGIFIDLRGVLEGQVIQEQADLFKVRVVAGTGFGVREEQLIRQRFEDRLGQVRVILEKVPEIPRTERGKFRAVISNVKTPNSGLERVVPGLADRRP